MKTQILVVDDHAVFRSGMRALLEAEPDLQVVAEAGTGQEALEQLANREVDVLLLDLSLPGGMPGSQVARFALRDYPELAIVVLTMHEDEYYLREMLGAGVHGYVLKKSDTEEVVRAIRAACAGKHFVDPALVGHVVGSYVGRSPNEENGVTVVLTNREREVCRLLAAGHTNAEVGELLSISKRTVETHRSNIMTKLGTTSRVELVRYAIDAGLLKV